MSLTDKQIEVIKKAKPDEDYRIFGHGSTINSLVYKGYAKYLGFHHNLGSVFGLTEKGLEYYRNNNHSE